MGAKFCFLDLGASYGVCSVCENSLSYSLTCIFLMYVILEQKNLNKMYMPYRMFVGVHKNSFAVYLAYARSMKYAY